MRNYCFDSINFGLSKFPLTFETSILARGNGSFFVFLFCSITHFLKPMHASSWSLNIFFIVWDFSRYTALMIIATGSGTFSAFFSRAFFSSRWSSLSDFFDQIANPSLQEEFEIPLLCDWRNIINLHQGGVSCCQPLFCSTMSRMSIIHFWSSVISASMLPNSCSMNASQCSHCCCAVLGAILLFARDPESILESMLQTLKSSGASSTSMDFLKSNMSPYGSSSSSDWHRITAMSAGDRKRLPTKSCPVFFSVWKLCTAWKSTTRQATLTAERRCCRKVTDIVFTSILNYSLSFELLFLFSINYRLLTTEDRATSELIDRWSAALLTSHSQAPRTWLFFLRLK